MRNIFDQYSQPENRITHALMTALQRDRKLLGLFLRELVGVKPPCHPSRLAVLEQQYPGEEEPSEEELERRGIPDGWIFDSDGWCVFIETKVIAKLEAGQLERHRRTAERRGFNAITAVAIAPRLPAILPPGTVLLEWRNIYAWLRRHASISEWASIAAEYLEIAEAKLIDSEQFVEGTLTTFSGIPFGHDHPFTYLEGKRVLELAMGELRRRRDLRDQLKMNPKAPGRSAITGRQSDAVWDFLSLASSGEVENFTSYPHLTLGVVAQQLEAMVTVPNAVNGTMRRNLIKLGEDGFQQLATRVVNNLKPLLRKHPGATPWCRGVQRRYPSQRAIPFVDARIDFDLRTAVPQSGSPKVQPRWLSAAYSSFVNKEGSNYQMQMGVLFRYDRCNELRDANALDLVAAAWLACRPLVDLAR
ncbi:PD-(D/E)XK nuclease family protein [Bradyrhizobium japonicum]|uniref:PD-(D/E)XK nuclease family protein n=1 Tax=Bradyrhizobium japonicum TaxID=375 RepID=UPI0020A13C31|nr:PD-(D/E)XK nuclease family protein [Bradyrhizobium japonicum]MCP1761995.1 hypothetical protein [Bradyrhizobium japonicum]MCP1793575.1 hypothetical protein [Bradyrhizobium japonicum]MCP1806008.1 hypothetical protein [Bradyrhizobium japonicum]MCP1812411.1 hypothetical protein [Bradyrhizobium japonicum]MCP1873546.1 hypothetical protein [Bradyrhizobium japonicum]